MRTSTFSALRLPILRASRQLRRQAPSAPLQRIPLPRTNPSVASTQTRLNHDQINANARPPAPEQEDKHPGPIWIIYFLGGAVIIGNALIYFDNRKSEAVAREWAEAAKEIGYLRGKVADLEKQLQDAKQVPSR
jgi:hypothetical protein